MNPNPSCTPPNHNPCTPLGCAPDPHLPAPRISGRIGQLIGLDTTFYHNGVATAPFAIRRIDIYKDAPQDPNKVAQILFPDPRSGSYPSPALTDPNRLGFFQVNWLVPADLKDGLYFDVWNFIGSDPGVTALGPDVGLGGTELTGPNITDGDPANNIIDNESTWFKQTNKFWLYQDGWFLDDGLIIPRLAFEPLDLRFRKCEIRTMEVGMIPLPLYDFDACRIMPLLTRLCAFITIETENCEVLVADQPCRIGLRQGTNRVSPYVVQTTIDTSGFLIGTYNYRIKVVLPNGESRISETFQFYVV